VVVSGGVVVVLDPPDVRPERPELLVEPDVAAVDVVDLRHLGDALGDQTGENQPGTRPDVGGPDRRSGQLRTPADDDVMPVGA
jgi:hypothetical protein